MCRLLTVLLRMNPSALIYIVHSKAGPSGLVPMSPHIQQNGFQPLPPQNTVGQQSYQTASQQSAGPQQSMNVAMNSQQQPVIGSTPVPCPPNGAGASGQGTWTGNSTLTYTQTMQPPDPRNQHQTYCKYLQKKMMMTLLFIKFVSYLLRATSNADCSAT